jgi:hypothetical protein
MFPGTIVSVETNTPPQPQPPQSNIKTSKHQTQKGSVPRQPHDNHIVIDPKIQNLFCPKQQSFPGFTQTHHPKEHLLFAQVVHQCLCQLRDVFPQHFFTFSGRFHCSLQTVFHHRLGGPRQFLRVIPVALA